MVASRERIEERRAPVHVICGSDAYLKREALAEVTRRVLGDAEPHMAFADYEGGSATLADVLDDLRTPPFLAEVRLVVVSDADPFITAHRQALETYVESPSSTGVLVLVCRSFPSNTRLAKAVARIGTVHACEPPKPRAIGTWLVQRAQARYDKRLQGEAAASLQRLAGDELGILDSELAKLAMYVGDRTAIKVEDVDALVGHHREEKVFGIMDAIADGDVGTALELWQQVWSTDRAAPARAVGGLAWGVRQMLNAQLTGRPGWRPGSRRAGSAGADRFAAPELEDRLVNLLAADVRAKTGADTVQSAVQQFIVAWCTGQERT